MTPNSPAWWRQFPPRLDITPPSQRLLRAHAAATVLLAAGAMLIAQISLPLKIGLLGGLAVLGALVWRRHLRPDAPRRVQRLIYTARRGWRLVDGAGVERRAVPLEGSFVHPWLTLLWLRSADGHRYLVALPAGGAVRHSIRRCRVVLRAGTGAWS